MSDAVEANRFGERQLLYSSNGSYHGYLASLGEQQPFHSYADYDNYLARIAQVPEQMGNIVEISRKGAREGYVQPCVTLGNMENSITGVIAADPTKSRFYAPFAATKPGNLSDAQWADLQARARALIASKINPAYQNWATVYHTEVAPKCRAEHRRFGNASGAGLLRFPGPPADHHQPDPRPDPPDRPQ